MNEQELKARWEFESPVYKAWGEYILNEVVHAIRNNGIDVDSFFKIPPQPRLKATKSLIDKAFNRDKNYSDPYSQIEDKVGIRFVVLLLDQIELICSLIEENPNWSFDPCKNFNFDRENEPLLFTYQSVHYILRPKTNINHNGVVIPADIPCEVQIRTLLQHAHAELTHDSIYKAKKKIQPKVHRTVAKSMALIETTDEFFSLATTQLNFGPLQEHNVEPQLDSLFFKVTGLRPYNQKSAMYLWAEFETQISDKLVSSIELLADKNPHLKQVICSVFETNTFFQQSVILFIFWMLKTHKRKLIMDWPLEPIVLERVATEFGITLNHD